MKYVKMLGLAAVAAAALMAFVGASTASATVLCTTKPDGAGKCAVGWGYDESQELHAVTTEKPKLTSSFKTVECDQSTMAGDPTNNGDATHTVSGSVDTLTFTGHCNCTVIVAAPGTLEIHAISDTGNGTVTSNGATVTVNCSTIFGNVHCNYVTNNKDIGILTGGSPATMNITIKIEEEATSGLCDSEATWHGNYSITTPGSLWVATATG